MNPNERDELAKQQAAATDGGGFALLGQISRVERGMVTDDPQAADSSDELSAERKSAIMSRFKAWRRAHPNPKDARKLRSYDACADEMSGATNRISGSTLSELARGIERGDAAGNYRTIEAFVSAEEKRAKRVEFPTHVEIDLVWKLWGICDAAYTSKRWAAFIGESGWGKTNLLLAYEREHPFAIYLRVVEENSTDRDISHLLCGVIPDLAPYRARPHRGRQSDINRWVRDHRDVMLLVDEAGKCARSGMEAFRTISDCADPAQQRGLPIAFAGDESFERLIVQAKGGAKTAVAPQVARRMLFIFNVDKQGSGCDEDGGDVLSVDDLLKIIHAGKLRVVTPAAARWLTRLANTPHSGHLGTALDTLRVAMGLAAQLGVELVDVSHLQTALQMSNGKALAKAIDAAAGGELLRVTA